MLRYPPREFFDCAPRRAVVFYRLNAWVLHPLPGNLIGVQISQIVRTNRGNARNALAQS